MKKFAMLLILLSLGMFTIGCSGGEEAAPAPEDTTEAPADDAGDAPADDAGDAPVDDEGEG